MPGSHPPLFRVKRLDLRTGATTAQVVDGDGMVQTPAPPSPLGDDAAVDGELTARSRAAKHDEPLDVAIWAKPPLPVDRRGDDRQPARLARLRRIGAGARRPIVRSLAALGVAAHEAEVAPVVFTRLTPAQLTRLARHPNVARLYGAAAAGNAGGGQATTAKAYPSWLDGRTGGATPVVVHEAGGVAPDNPYLRDGRDLRYWCADVSARCPSGHKVSDHATRVAGIVASTHPLVTGLAFGTDTVLSANARSYGDADLVAALEWAVDAGGSVVNMSWGTFCGGTDTFMARYVDWAVRELRITVVAAAGNHPSGCPSATQDEAVAAPALAWSAIAVGGFDDGGTGTWSDDAMSPTSDWRNPPGLPGLEKPEVVAVGERVVSTDAAGGDHVADVPGSGTSFAAPAIAGQVALMLDARPAQAAWPETNKAAVLASAFHDVEKGSRSRDGTGAPLANVGTATYELGRYANDCGPGCVPLTAGDFPRRYDGTIQLEAGQRGRVAIAWDPDASPSGGASLGGDLDLCVVPSGATVPVACSASLDNAWEVVDFTAPAAGAYDVVVRLTSATSGWSGSFLGMAWATRRGANLCSRPRRLPASGGTTDVSTEMGPTYVDTYSGWPHDQSGRELTLRIDLAEPATLVLSDDNPLLDLHLVRIQACTGNPLVLETVASAADRLEVGVGAGSHHVLVDGRGGAVGQARIHVEVRP